jgi:hypothetical protein
MRWSRISVLFCLALIATARGQTVQVTMTLDDADGILLPGQSTTLHLFAQVENGQQGNGIYGYALDLLENHPPIVQLNSVTQFGDPWASRPGIILDTGLKDVYAGDGGFFIDPNRGIDSPFELLSVDLTVLLPGDVTIMASRATDAFLLGAPDGFLLQDPGRVNVDFGPGVTISVVPEPATLVLVLLLGAAGFARHPDRHHEP